MQELDVGSSVLSGLVQSARVPRARRDACSAGTNGPTLAAQTFGDVERARVGCSRGGRGRCNRGGRRSPKRRRGCAATPFAAATVASEKGARSGEGRVGKEWRSPWAPNH